MISKDTCWKSAIAGYTRRFGGGRVMRSDVLRAKPGNEEATVVFTLEIYCSSAYSSAKSFAMTG